MSQQEDIPYGMYFDAPCTKSLPVDEQGRYVYTFPEPVEMGTEETATIYIKNVTNHVLRKIEITPSLTKILEGGTTKMMDNIEFSIVDVPLKLESGEVHPIVFKWRPPAGGKDEEFPLYMTLKVKNERVIGRYTVETV